VEEAGCSVVVVVVDTEVVEHTVADMTVVGVQDDTQQPEPKLDN